MKIKSLLRFGRISKRSQAFFGVVCALVAVNSLFQNCVMTQSSVDGDFEVPPPVNESTAGQMDLFSPERSPAETTVRNDLPDFNLPAEVIRPKPRIAMSRNTTCVSPREKVYCFGDNSSGQGANSRDGATLKVASSADLFNDPIYLNADQSIESLSGGDDHVCARMSTDRLICWGKNDHGQTGRADANSSEPKYVDLTGMDSSFAADDVLSGAGVSFTVSGGDIYCWGDCGGFVESSPVRIPTKIRVSFPEPVVSVAVCRDAAHPKLCAVLQSSKAMCVEPGGEPQYVANPQSPESAALGIRQVVVGPEFECFLIQDAVLCRGSNTRGALGIGPNRSSTQSLVLVYGLGKGQKIKQIVNAGYSTCALNEDQLIFCWGSNINGALGIGEDCTEKDESCFSEYPRIITFSNKFKGQKLAVREIAGTEALNSGNLNASRFCLLFEDGGVACWGQRYLGDGAETYGDPAKTFASKLKSTHFSVQTTTSVAANESTEEFQSGGGPGTEVVQSADRLPDKKDDSGPVRFERRMARSRKMTCAFPDLNMYCWGAEGQGYLGGSENQKGKRTLLPTYADQLNAATDLNKDQTFLSTFSVADGKLCALLSTGKVRCWTPDKFEYMSVFGSASGQVKASDVLARATNFWVMLLDGGIKYWDGVAASAAWVKGFSDTAAVKVDAIATQAGATKVCALMKDSTVRCFADSNGSTDSVKNPSDTSKSLDGIRQVVVGYDHQCFLVGDAVACMGKNDKGQLGIGNTVDSPSMPVIVSGLGAGAQVKMLAANGNTTCAVKTSNEVLCWGSNQDGALGGGASPDCSGSNSTAASCYVKAPQRVVTTDKVPANLSIEEIEILGNSNITDTASDYRQVCIRLSNKGISCWGGKYLGNNTLNSASKPTPVGFDSRQNVPTSDSEPTPSSTTAFESGKGVSDGTLGAGKDVERVPRSTGGASAPPPVPVSSRFAINSQEDGGGQFTEICAFPDKKMYCWGNGNGYLAGTETNKNKVIKIPTEADVLNNPEHLKDSQYFSQLAEGPGYWRDQCVLMSNGKIRCWNINEVYYLTSYWAISGTISQIKMIPGKMHLLVDGGVMSVIIGEGDSQRKSSSPPAYLAPFPKGSDVKALGRGRSSSPVVIFGDGTAKVTNGGPDSYKVIEDPENRGTSLKGISQVAEGGGSYCVLVYDGVLCGGTNTRGQLGDGTTMNSPTYTVPVIAKGLSSGVKLIAGNYDTFCAVKTDESVYCWGRNMRGILGVGVNENDCSVSANQDNSTTLGCRSLEPRLVTSTDKIKSSGKKIVQIEVAQKSACIMMDDKSMSCWGDYPGNGTTNSNIPVAVQFPSP